MKLLNSFVILLLLTGIGLASFTVGKAIGEQNVITSVSQEWSPKIIAGVIKPNSSGTWSILEDSYHNQIGLTDITQTSQYIKVYYPSCEKVVSSSVTGDEIFASADLQVGASVGLDYALIYTYRDKALIDPSTIRNTQSNIWFEMICK